MPRAFAARDHFWKPFIHTCAPQRRSNTRQVEEADIRTYEYAPSGMIILNFTLQFLPPADRDALLKRLYDTLEPGGVLILSEKTVYADERDNAWRVERYHDFKRANGYSDMEISQKRTALENVLIPDTLDALHAEFRQIAPLAFPILMTDPKRSIALEHELL